MSKTNGQGNGKANPDSKADAGPIRDELGRIRKGHTLNREGGRRTHLVLCRETLQAIMDAPVSDADKRPRIEAFWLNLFERSMEGDGTCSKILADRLLPATIKADVNVTGMTPGGVGGVISIMRAEYVKRGNLESLDD